MTQVALYVVLNDDGWFSAGHNIGGYEVDQVVALGPDIALRYITALVDDDASADDFWDSSCTAGALVDLRLETLLVFTDMLEYGPRAAFLDGLPRTWPGWEMRWAFDWSRDFCDYPGVEAPRRPSALGLEVLDFLPDLSEFPRAIVTVADAGGVRAYEFDVWAAGEPWLLGPSLLNLLREDQLCTRPAKMPIMGMHLDTETATAGVWTTRTWLGLTTVWPRLWPGWSLQLWGSRAEEQVTRTGAPLDLPALDMAAERTRYAARLDALWLNTLEERRTTPRDRARPTDAVGLTEAEYQRQRRLAISAP